MRDCTEPKRQPAGPACCLRDCKLSLRMQTDKQDRHHLPILPSMPPMHPPSAPLLFLSFTLFPGDYSPFFFRPCTCMFMNSLIYFLYLARVAAPPLLSVCRPGLFSVDKMSRLAVYSPLSLFNGSLLLHRR